MASSFQATVIFAIVFVGSILCVTYWNIFSSGSQVEALTAKVRLLEQRVRSLESEERIQSDESKGNSAIDEAADITSESSGEVAAGEELQDSRDDVKQQVVVPEAKDSTQLHRLVLEKVQSGKPCARCNNACTASLSQEGRDGDPFGVPLWRRVLTEHKRSKYGDCRLGLLKSGCNAFVSQGFQDVFLYTALWRHLNRTGVYVDLAANDFYYISNTFFADHCLKFDGICIEANKRYFPMLKNGRRCVVEETCVAEKTKKVEFNMQGVFGGIIGEKKDAKSGSGFVKKMTCQPLSKIFAKYGVVHVDYMNLDVEGVELQCLEGVNWNEVTIDVIGIERNEHFSTLEKFLLAKQYIRTVTVSHDVIFVHKTATRVLEVLTAWRRDDCHRINVALKSEYYGKDMIPEC